MFDRTLRIGTICVLVPGTLGALAGVIGVGPAGISPASEALVLIGFAGMAVLHLRHTVDVCQGLP